MGPNILDTTVLNDTSMDQARIDKIIMEAHGFAEVRPPPLPPSPLPDPPVLLLRALAQVLPEHKFQVVERIRKNGHVTGMTGDGVNDAPALKRADIGIAVHGATDAARAAADIVLTEEGLSVIIEAIFESRKIFQRMRTYIIYRIACTLQLLCFFFIGAERTGGVSSSVRVSHRRRLNRVAAIIAVSPDGPSAYNYNYGQKVWPMPLAHGSPCTVLSHYSCPALHRRLPTSPTRLISRTRRPSRSPSSRSSSSRSSTTAA